MSGWSAAAIASAARPRSICSSGRSARLLKFSTASNGPCLSKSFQPLDQLGCVDKNPVQGLLGEPAGVRVLGARVVGADQMQPTDLNPNAVPESGLGVRDLHPIFP